MILPSKHLVVVVAVAFLAFFGFLYANSEYDKIMAGRDSAAERDWIAAKNNWKQLHTKTVAVIATIAQDSVTIQRERAKAGAALHVADSLRRLRTQTPPPVYADSTNPRWRGLYYGAVVEADSLRSVVKSDTVSLLGALSDVDKLRAQLLTVDTAGTRVVNTGQKLIDVRTCKILWLLDCPNRRVVAVGGVVLGAVAGAYLENRYKKP